MSSFKAWVKNKANDDEDAFKVDCEGTMDIDTLKNVIAVKLDLPSAVVRKVYPSCDKNAVAYTPDVPVVKPNEGAIEAIGAKASNPYYYSLTPAAAGSWCCICST